MLAALHPTAWYAWIAYVAGLYVLWSAAFETGHRQLRWLDRKVRGGRDEVGALSARSPAEDPYVVVGNLTARLSLTPLNELADGEHRRLVQIEPMYLIENKEPSVGIRDVTTGVRDRDGTEHRFDAFFAGLIGPAEKAQVASVGSTPPVMLKGVHESEAVNAFLYWARFTREGRRWEVSYDPQTMRNAYREIPPIDAKLDAFVRDRGSHTYRLAIRNEGAVSIEEVECVLPDVATNWHLYTDVLPSYPISALDPGDELEIGLAVTLGGPAAVNVTLQGTVEGVPYRRRRTLTM